MTAYDRLHRIVSHAAGYHELMDQHDDSLPAAAWDLASLKIKAGPRFLKPTPTETELWTAAIEIAQITGRGEPVPTKSQLAFMCRTAGKPVL